MYESFRRRSCVSPRMDRKPPFVIVHILLSLMICLSLACATRNEAGTSCPAIEMSAVADTQTASSKSVTLNDTTTILMSRPPLVATGDITSATASQAEDHWVLNFTVTDVAAKRVHEFSKQHVGRNLAPVVDGKVHGTPRIAAAIIGNRYRIRGFNRADAERLATAISNGCRRQTPPVPPSAVESDADQPSGSPTAPTAGPRSLNPEGCVGRSLTLAWRGGRLAAQSNGFCRSLPRFASGPLHHRA